MDSLFGPREINQIETLKTENVTTQLINGKTAQKVISENHYSHSCPPPHISFGFYINDEEAGVSSELCTVAAYTEGANHHAPAALFEDSTHKDMLELVRLFSFDWAPANIESYCIGQTFQ